MAWDIYRGSGRIALARGLAQLLASLPMSVESAPQISVTRFYRLCAPTAAQIDLRSEKETCLLRSAAFKEMVEQFGTAEIYERILKRLETSG